MDPDNGKTNFLNLGLYGIKFFLLNIVGHDFSHDFTNERLKDKLTHFKMALTNSKAPSSDEIDLTSTDIKNVNNYDTVVKVNQADENIKSIIKTTSGKAAPSKKPVASTKAAVPPPPPPAETVSKKPAASKKSAAPSTEPPPPPPTEAAAVPSAVSSSSDDVAQDQVMEEIIDDENNEREIANIGEILLAFANQVQYKILERVAPITRSRFYALQCAANFVSDVKIKVIGKFDQSVRVDGGDSNPTLEYISNSYSDDDIKRSNIKTMKSKITRDTKKTYSADRKKHRLNTRKLHSELRKINDMNKHKSNTRKLHSEMRKISDRNKHKSNVQKIMYELTKKQTIVNNNKQFDAIIKNALYQEISETSKLPGCEQLNKYYKAMLQLYLCFTPSNDLSPLDIFNLDIIEEALILHVMYEDVDPIVLLKIVIKIKKGNAEKGILFGGAGSHQEIVDMIEETEGFDKFKDQYSNSNAITPADLNDSRDSSYNFLKTIVDELIGTINKPKYEALSIKRNVINSRLELINLNLKLITKPTRAPRESFVNRTRLTIYTNYLKILFEDVYDGCLRASKQDAAAAEELAGRSADTPLAIVADKPCKIVATVARGILKFMIASLPGGFPTTPQSHIFNNGKSDKEEALYDAQLNMIHNLANIKIRGGDTLDENLLTCMKAYASSKSALVNAAAPSAAGKNNKIILINSDEEFKSNLLPNPDIINNGARSILPNYGMRDSNVTCTLGSIIDPMGSFGNCSTTTVVSEKEGFVKSGSRLSLATDVFMSDNDGTPTNYYSGRLDQPDPRRSILQYSFKYGEFMLPPVIKTIDTRSSNIIELSVSNTYKSIINKILFMWSNLVIPLQADGTIDVNKLFDRLIENEGAFIDILSCSTIKNAGDLYQEIGGTIKNRGYDKSQIASEGKNYTNQMIEVNNDRPSGSRGAFILLNGNSNEVNTNAMAGYISEKNCFCVRRTK